MTRIATTFPGLSIRVEQAAAPLVDPEVLDALTTSANVRIKGTPSIVLPMVGEGEAHYYDPTLIIETILRPERLGLARIPIVGNRHLDTCFISYDDEPYPVVTGYDGVEGYDLRHLTFPLRPSILPITIEPIDVIS
jgi:hypothetical protein